jgi:hypothetical protein
MSCAPSRMGGAKRYPSTTVDDPDGFRKVLNPSYELAKLVGSIGESLAGVRFPLVARRIRLRGVKAAAPRQRDP